MFEWINVSFSVPVPTDDVVTLLLLYWGVSSVFGGILTLLKIVVDHPNVAYSTRATNLEWLVMFSVVIWVLLPFILLVVFERLTGRNKS